MTTTLHEMNATMAFDDEAIEAEAARENELTTRYQTLITHQRLSWTTHHRLIRMLGKGGQGVVFLSERRGADDFTLPVAVKFFSPARYESPHAYDEAMVRMARIGARVAQIQQDNLLDVHNFVDRSRIRMMVMEWVDGYDLKQLLSNSLMNEMQLRIKPVLWDQISRITITHGPAQARFKPGVAVAIVRECLAAIAALHREGIVHGDIKPANIMLKCTGNAKIVDIGSAFHVDDPPPVRTCTPTYAAPEVLQGSECTPRSDLASLGYVLIEMLSGQPIFAGMQDYRELLAAKLSLSQELDALLPSEVTCNQLLMNFCRGLIAPDPMRRFPSAEAANLLREGAAAFLRQLIFMDLAAEYDNEIRVLVREIKQVISDDELPI